MKKVSLNAVRSAALRQATSHVEVANDRNAIRVAVEASLPSWAVRDLPWRGGQGVQGSCRTPHYVKLSKILGLAETEGCRYPDEVLLHMAEEVAVDWPACLTAGLDAEAGVNWSLHDEVEANDRATKLGWWLVKTYEGEPEIYHRTAPSGRWYSIFDGGRPKEGTFIMH